MLLSTNSGMLSTNSGIVSSSEVSSSESEFQAESIGTGIGIEVEVNQLYEFGCRFMGRGTGIVSLSEAQSIFGFRPGRRTRWTSLGRKAGPTADPSLEPFVIEVVLLTMI